MKKKTFDNEEARKVDLLDLLTKYGISLTEFPYEWLCTTEYFTSPASTKYHAAYPGGLYDHCRNMTNVLLHLTNKGITVPWSRPESPVIVGMLHDITKVGKYKELYPEARMDYPAYEYIGALDYGGHGSDSLIKVLQHMRLTEEESMCIRYHMGAYEQADWKNMDKAIKKYPNVLWTHVADMVASKLMED